MKQPIFAPDSSQKMMPNDGVERSKAHFWIHNPQMLSKSQRIARLLNHFLGGLGPTDSALEAHPSIKKRWISRTAMEEVLAFWTLMIRFLKRYFHVEPPRPGFKIRFQRDLARWQNHGYCMCRKAVVLWFANTSAKPWTSNFTLHPDTIVKGWENEKTYLCKLYSYSALFYGKQKWSWNGLRNETLKCGRHESALTKCAYLMLNRFLGYIQVA